ncbi:2,5-diamino-6-(ribosylamino)-4(3H)-pyrimidinone 5'-phosphate reductase [Methanobrevibacter filiformis]|uniref:2,5-diamino-6-(ribosylamino)-4(3H)-pyrimidinone 5'-phosphate reductase n=1 Tax=Methanobrevibacter filiformis TaxID=55758 RepID=A0A165Z8B6_9EURY|nr:2,5-diamino-6-(ribosylamino)-4(3H)-pyrimidinone 5'-phosphate reductase [Methanobrevibacter filiformis]KZX10382.1 2,5-diamino-6-ribosylamino-4(3H)-pyrimidinone 5'-phosphate reductase [Methanobrevibacter filiformis]
MKPYVILNAAMTLDGKIATKTGSSEISGLEDIMRVHKLRKDVDGIMVGINTVLSDNPKLTTHKISSNDSDNPVRVIVDSKARTPHNSNVLNDSAKTIIAISKEAVLDENYLDNVHFLEKYVDVFVSGEYKVDLNELMKYLFKEGIKTLMLEGGSTLNFSMFKEGLIDEINICIAPMVVGGKYSKTLVDGEGFGFMKNAIPLKLKDILHVGEDLVLKYDVLNIK